jgi:hypothetical protein
MALCCSTMGFVLSRAWQPLLCGSRALLPAPVMGLGKFIAMSLLCGRQCGWAGV